MRTQEVSAKYKHPLPASGKGKIMDKIRREDIDKMILESFQETGSDDVLSGFSDSLNSNIAALEENGIDLDDQVTIFLSSIITAQANAINTIRRVLYKIFCPDETSINQKTTEVNKNVLNK